MRHFKGALSCPVCHKKVIVLGGQQLHVETDGALKLVQDHGLAVGGGR